MLRAIGRRLDRGASIAVLVLVTLAALGARNAAASSPDPATGPREEVRYESGAAVRLGGVDHDRRFGRGWLIARLPSEGHLRTASARLKAFAPPGEYEAGLVRIPLIPKQPVAKLLRQQGRAFVTVAIYFKPKGATESQTLQKTVTLIRSAHARPTGPRH